jgi:spore coat polysaccharide biosynthesis protein SpsF
MQNNYNINTAAFIYARSDSSRLPKKVFMPLGHKPLIEVILERAETVFVDEVVILTSYRTIDDEIEEIAKKLNCKIVRGHPTDLIERTLMAIEKIKPKKFIRINADSPFFEPKILNLILEKNYNYDIITNLIKRTFPYGVAVEIIESSFYCKMVEFALIHEKEHVTQHIYKNIKDANLLEVEQKNDHSDISLAIDSIDDYKKINELWKNMKNNLSSYWDVVNLEKPQLLFKT